MSRPHAIRYRGHKYVLASKRKRDAALPVKQAERKLEQVGRTVHRLEGQDPNIKPVMPFMSNWEINREDIMKSVNRDDGGNPEIIMWNPLTSEFLMGSNMDDRLRFHVDLHRRAGSDLISYPDSGYDDWARAFVMDSGWWGTYNWEPLRRHAPYFYGTPAQKEADRYHESGTDAFTELLMGMGLEVAEKRR